MDPITAIAIASTAFNAIKKGIQIGKDVESMSGDISRWMGAIGNVREAEKKAKNPPLFICLFNRDTVEREALDAFAAMKKAKAMENELRTFINFEYGPNAWNEILKIQADIRKQRLQEKRKRDDIKESAIMWSLILATIVMSLGILYLVFKNI